jgi:L-ribulokinase
MTRNKKYAIGIDYGTESGRAVLVDIATGEETAAHVTPYPHGVIDEKLPGTEIMLGYDWALQHPDDYLEVLRQSVPAVLREAGASPEEVIGIGIDFTACTMLPLNGKGEPLCFEETWREHPHAWVKLWKHHAAQEEANGVNQIAAEREEAFLSRYGGKLSSEWMIAKLWQIVNDAPEVYEAADLFMEAADWVVMQMTDHLVRNSCTAGFKAQWHKNDGYPSESFFASLDERLRYVTSTKLRGSIAPLGSKAGELTERMAAMMGLRPGIAVAVGNIDAHAMVPASGVVTPGKLLMAMGTSTCHLLLSDKEVLAEGICGVVEDGIIAGYYGYEAGQSAVGDLFAWYVDKAVPSQAKEAAAAEGISIHAWLEREAARYKPGQTGLLALDWWNGNRSVLMNADLSGLLIGMTLQTKPEEIYRTLLEATAFGTRRIIEAFESKGIAVEELYACGGLPQKNQLLMQIYADVTGREIRIAASVQTAALGAAMFGAVAAGAEAGGYGSIEEAALHMARVKEETFKPVAAHTQLYDQLYAEYVMLHDYFGKQESRLMKKLKALKNQ